jgi:photoactive yellow protein
MLQHDTDLVEFADIGLAQLDALTRSQVDELSFGVIGLSAEGIVEVYNATESRLAGLSAMTVLGTHFFQTTAQCMNNFMVAQRFEDEVELDATIDFVLTLRMRPTRVRLRMLKGRSARRQYILIQR